MHPLSYFALTFALVMYAESGTAAVHKRTDNDTERPPNLPLYIPEDDIPEIRTVNIKRKELNLKDFDAEELKRYFASRSPLKIEDFQSNLNEDSDRIIEGVHAEPHEYPHQVFMYIFLSDGRVVFCGGFILTTKHVGTAFHCVADRSATSTVVNVVVVAGAHEFYETSESSRQLSLAKLPGYSWGPVNENFKFDISVLEMEIPFFFNAAVGAVCLSNEVIGEGVTITAKGWGKETPDAVSIAPVLNKIELITISNNECRNISIQNFKEDHSNERPWALFQTDMCAYDYNGAKGVCFGDSGGAATIQTDGRYYVVGINTFGSEGCQTDKYASGFMRIEPGYQNVMDVLGEDYNPLTCG